MSNLPTLLSVGNFSFNDAANVPEIYKEMLASKKAVDIIIEIIKEKLDSVGPDNRLYFLNARTGSGKSTILITELYNNFIRGTTGTLLVSEPRVNLSISNPTEIVRWSRNVEDKIGYNVGYLTGPIKTRCTSKNGILYYSTAQIATANLLKIVNGDIALQDNNIKIVVIDEAHLLEIQILELINVIHSILQRYGENDDCPLFIFASATLNLPPFLRYFLKVLTRFPTVEAIYKSYLMIGYVSGKANYPVKLTYNSFDKYYKQLSSFSNNFDKVRNTVYKIRDYLFGYLKLHDLQAKPIEEKGNDLLIFFPKTAAINTAVTSITATLNERFHCVALGIDKNITYEAFMKWRDANRNKVRFVVIGYARNYSVVSDAILKYAMEQDEEARIYERKIFLCTPVIETGKTITSLRYVIDTGLELKPVYNPLVYDPASNENLYMLPVSKSGAIQRLGRVGREQSGECMRLYSENAYEMLDEDTLPETINNYCLSYVYVSQFKAYAMNQYLDIFNDNNYLFKISYDILFRSVLDLIRSGFYSIFSCVTEAIVPLREFDNLIFYTQYLYYVLGCPLFTSLVYVQIHARELGNDLFPNINITKDNVKIDTKQRVEFTTMEGIKKARNMLTLILYDPSYYTLRNLYGRLF